MLVILLGPSGVGKTSIIQLLEAHFDWKVVPSVVTRPLRTNERYKHSLTDEAYCSLLDQGLLFTHVEQFGFKYGTVRKDIDLAERSAEPWVLDFDIKSYFALFGKTVHRAYIIVPADSEQLEAQLRSAGRADRIHDAIDQLRWINETVRPNIEGTGSPMIVVNGPDELLVAALEVAESAGFAHRPKL